MEKLEIRKYIFTIAGILLLIILLQLFTNKYGSKYFCIILWFILTVPSLIWITNKNKIDDLFIKKTIVIYLIILVLYFFSQPFWSIYLHQSFADSLLYSLIFFVSYQALIFYLLIRDSNNCASFSRFLSKKDNKKLKLDIASGELDKFFSNFQNIIKNLKLEDISIDNEITVFESKWNSIKKNKNLGLINHNEISTQESRLINGILNFIQESTIL